MHRRDRLSKERAKAARAFHNQLLTKPTEKRRPAEGPLSFAVKAREPGVDAAVATFLATGKKTPVVSSGGAA